MCKSHSNICAECGSPISSLQNIGYTCDNCGRYICNECWNNLQTVHVKQPTKSGITGFIKLCKDCRTRTDETSVTPNPFIG